MMIFSRNTNSLHVCILKPNDKLNEKKLVITVLLDHIYIATNTCYGMEFSLITINTSIMVLMSIIGVLEKTFA